MEKKKKALDDYLAELKGAPREPFRPCALYNDSLDNLEVYLSDEKAITEWIGPEIAIMRSSENGKLVGVLVHGMKKLVSA